MVRSCSSSNGHTARFCIADPRRANGSVLSVGRLATSSRYVPVRLGMFGNGRVQITGAGIAAGTLVGVPS
jgi:hypothetical protein